MAVTTSPQEIAAYIRVSALAISLFDVVQTLPGEFRLYARQRSIFRLSPACILFIIVRYASIVALVSSGVGFFYHGFPASVCRHYSYVALVFKLFATYASWAIISIRAYAVSRKARWVFWTLTVVAVLCSVCLMIGNFAHRTPVQTNGNCTSGNLPGVRLAWQYYLGTMVYDAVTMGIATFYLYSSSSGLSMMSSLTRMMLEEGLFFFLALTSSNVLNVVLFQSADLTLQSSAATLGYAMTMIFSSKFILSLSDSIFERSSGADRSSRNRSHSRDARPGVFPRSTYFSRGGRSFVGDKSAQTVELDIRVDKDVQITMDDLRPYESTSAELPGRKDDDFETSKTKGVTWQAE